MAEEDAASLERREQIDDLLTGTFNSLLRIEERSLDNRLMKGLTINEVHTIVAIGLYESNPMNVVAARLDVTLATLAVSVNRLQKKGFVKRERDEVDRRKVLVSLTTDGRKVYRVHSLFHRNMVNEALCDLSVEEERVLADALMRVKAFFDKQIED